LVKQDKLTHTKKYHRKKNNNNCLDAGVYMIITVPSIISWERAWEKARGGMWKEDITGKNMLV